MCKAVLYYRQKENENTDETIRDLNSLVKQLEHHYTIKGVYIDRFSSHDEFYNLMNSYQREDIDVIILKEPLNDEFDEILLNEIARTENIRLKLWDQ
ncbi:MAG: hypothetical protein ACQEWW_23030 [Bacillota bacterium]